MFIDTTQITLLEEEKAQSNYQRQMLANVSHEFRTPLNSMSMSLYLMKDSVSKKMAKFHRIASSSCDILKGLVEDILDLSKIESGVFEIEKTVFSFMDLFAEVKEIFELQANGKGLNLEFNIEKPLRNIKVLSDQQRLKQILLNLISNSLKFTDRGSIKINLRLQKQEKIHTNSESNFYSNIDHLLESPAINNKTNFLADINENQDNSTGSNLRLEHYYFTPNSNNLNSEKINI